MVSGAEHVFERRIEAIGNEYSSLLIELNSFSLIIVK